MRYIISALLILQFSFCYSQVYKGLIISKTNDTTRVKIIIKGNLIFENNQILSIQKNITIQTNTKPFDLYPKDIKSFIIQTNDETKVYDNINNTEFAERLYVNKAKLYYKLVKQPTSTVPYYTIYRVYMVINPDGEIKYLVPGGFSRLLSKKQMQQTFYDCPAMKDKINNDEIKIKNEEKLIEFIKIYEKDCI